jgi:hypothetical protein
MRNNVFTTVPAGVLGTGRVDARPYSCTAVRPSLLGAVAAAPGTRVPAPGLLVADAGMSPIFRGWTGAGTAPAIGTKHDQIQNDGTTPLGNHSPGRPLS